MSEHGKEKIKAGTTGQELKVQTTAWRGKNGGNLNGF